MARSALIVALLLLGGLAGCRGERHEYPADVVEHFVSACQVRADERTCECAIDELRGRYTFEEYQALERRIADPDVVREMAEAVDACR